MKTGCLVCLEAVHDGEYHGRCLKELFGIGRPPEADVELSKLHTLALAMVGHTSISGVQRKISVGLVADRLTLQVALAGGRYILKPQAGTFPELPENEHVTMRLARGFGIEIPPCGLVRLRDGTLAYVVARFDRPATGGKVHQEDFCQLAEKPPKDKYTGSAELCVRLLRRHAAEPLIDILKLYRQLVFAWWTGNGDLHLKNLAVLIPSAREVRLSPAYDLLSTQLVIPGDPLALPVSGKKDGLSRQTWLQLATYCGLTPRATARVLAQPGRMLAKALGLIERSALSPAMQQQYRELLSQRAGLL